MFPCTRASRLIAPRFIRRLTSVTSTTNLHPIPSETISPQELRLHKQLTYAHEQSDARRVEDLWQHVKQTYASHDSSGSHTPDSLADAKKPKAAPKTPPLPPLELCNRFLNVLMSLRRPTLAISLWNDMIRLGLSPDLRSWQALIEGCRHARDAASLEDVWRRAVASDVDLDAHCWTTRIHGLIMCGRWEAGVDAFTEMCRHWLSAAQQHLHPTNPLPHDLSPETLSALSDLPRAIKPTTSTVNAALAALLKHNNLAAAHTVLSLASSLGIPSDLVTYNTLLRHDIRHNASRNALSLLSSLQSQSLTPDIYTFTILLDGLWRHRPHSPATEADETAALLALLSTHGLAPTPTTYSTLITHLLAPPHSNLPLARAVLAHMEARNLPPSPHIPTILLTHMFAPPDRAPPDLPAITAYTEQLFRDTRQNRVLDHIFYERLVRGYAKHRMSGCMMDALKRMLREGRGGLSWDGLREVVGCLRREGRREAVREVVEGVKSGGWSRRGKGEKIGAGGRGEERFWDVVREVGCC